MLPMSAVPAFSPSPCGPALLTIHHRVEPFDGGHLCGHRAQGQKCIDAFFAEWFRICAQAIDHRSACGNQDVTTLLEHFDQNIGTQPLGIGGDPLLLPPPKFLPLLGQKLTQGTRGDSGHQFFFRNCNRIPLWMRQRGPVLGFAVEQNITMLFKEGLHGVPKFLWPLN